MIMCYILEPVVLDEPNQRQTEPNLCILANCTQLDMNMMSLTCLHLHKIAMHKHTNYKLNNF